jgi:hypothetical protein
MQCLIGSLLTCEPTLTGGVVGLKERIKILINYSNYNNIDY